MKIVLLVHNAYGIGGTVRATANLAGALAVRHTVEVVSVHRVADEPKLPFDARVRLTPLIDMRENSPAYEGTHELTGKPNTMFPDKGVDFGKLRYTALHDQRIADYLQQTDAHVVIATRPILNGYLARYGQTRCLRIGQEHLSFDAHSDQLRTDQNTAVAEGLDAFVTVSEADARLYRAALPDVRASVLCIPNGVPEPAVEPSTLGSKTIVAAGRLVAVKRYDRLVDAFAKVATEHPDWTLRIYGRGPERARLRQRIDELGLYDRAFLMGPVSPIETEWAKGAVAAVASDMESFGMTIVEAMHCGVPVVATDCPHGPAEIITHGQDGLLVPLDGGTDAFAASLKRLIEDEDLRGRLGHSARETARRYAPSAVARRYDELFHDLSGRRYLANLQQAAPARPSLRARLRSALRTAPTRTRTPSPAVQPTAAVPAPKRPAASARSTADGGLTVRWDAATLPPGPLDFVLRLRKDPDRREIRLPVPDVATAVGLSNLSVTVERHAHRLAEGRWDCYVAPRGTDKRQRLTAQLVEQSRLLTLPPAPDEAGPTSWIPYTTTDGFLAVRTWQRAAHAEIDTVLIGEDHATFTATLYGAARLPAQGATVVAHSREGAAYDTTARLHVLDDRRFRFSLCYSEALALRSAEHDLWDLRLHLAPGADPVRIGRISGDIVERKKIDTWPAHLLEHPQRGTTRIKPFLTATNDLGLSARDAVPAQKGTEPA